MYYNVGTLYAQNQLIIHIPTICCHYQASQGEAPSLHEHLIHVVFIYFSRKVNFCLILQICVTFVQ